MTTNRRYPDGCVIATALDHVGERWALLVVRELLLGPKRFTDLQEGLPGAGPKILAQRLRELEAAGVVRRRALPPPAASQVYELTEWGAALEPAVLALARWGAAAPEHRPAPESANPAPGDASADIGSAASIPAKADADPAPVGADSGGAGAEPGGADPASAPVKRRGAGADSVSMDAEPGSVRADPAGAGADSRGAGADPASASAKSRSAGAGHVSGGSEPGRVRVDPVSADSAVIKLRTLFTPQVQRPWSATYELRLGRHRFIAQVVDGQLVQVRRGEPDGSSDTVIDTDPDTLSAVLAEDRALARALGDGKLTIKGDDEAAHRLFEASRA